MENIIEQIIDIDKRAQQKYIDANAYQQKAEDEVRNAIKKMDMDTRKNSNDKLNRMRESQNVMLAEKVHLLAQELSEHKKSLDSIYQQHHLEWEHDLFEKALGR